jgi:acrylyl-CoA reductase (NADPH)
MDSGASIAVAGNTAGNELTASVLPFLLRGVNLLGMDSVAHPSERRGPLWERMGGLVDAEVLEGLASEAGLDDLPRLAEEILGGNVRGRVVVTPSS